MSLILSNTIIGFFVGIIGTGLGGVIAISVIKPNERLLSILMGFTGGLMLSIVAFDLLPESNIIGGVWIEIIGIILGVLLVFFIEDIVPIGSDKHNMINKKNFLKTGVILGIGIALHNIPEGLAIGSGLMLTSDIGMKLALTITLHNIPEGVAMATPLRISGSSKTKVFLITLVCGIPTGVGALAGALLGSISDLFIALCLSFAGGTMLYIICGELIPNSKNIHKGRSSTIGFALGFIVGIIIVYKL